MASKRSTMNKFDSLPPHLIIDIFSRLAINSVLQCKLVCNTWNDIVHDTFFAHLHLCRTMENNKKVGFIFFKKTDRYTLNKAYFAEYDDQKSSHKIVEINHHPIEIRWPPLTIFYNRKLIVGSCNGLICLSEPRYNDPICIFNPMTGEYINLPRFDTGKYLRQDFVRGFGYHPKTKEYKVVRKICEWPDSKIISSSDHKQFEVYTLGNPTRGWRNIEDAPYVLDYSSPGILVDGALHWLTPKSHTFEVNRKIVSLNLEDEKFRLIQPPSCLCLGNLCSLQVLGGCLCVIDSGYDTCLHVWMLLKKTESDGEIKEKWSKAYTIREEDNNNCNLLEFWRFQPFSLTRSGEILMFHVDYKTVLAAYDPKTKSVRVAKDHGLLSWFGAVPHVRSLVSLKSLCGDAKRMQMEKTEVFNY